MYKIIYYVNSGKFVCHLSIQDGTEQWEESSKDKAVFALIKAARIMNGMFITQNDIEFFTVNDENSSGDKISLIEIDTWADLEVLISKMTPEQKAQPVQIAKPGPFADEVIELMPGVAFATVGELEIDYCRSSIDNRYHSDEFVILIDGNPHAKDGAVMYEGENWEIPIYPRNHDESANWTGPAQKLRDNERNLKRQKLAKGQQEIVKSRLKNLKS